MRERENRGAGDERESMWSVPRRFRRVYFPLFYFLGIIGIGWSVCYEASRIGSEGSYHDIANAVVMKAPAILLTAAFISLVITEGSMVLAEMVGDYLRKRREAAAAEAEAKGRTKGRAEGRAQMGREWSAWNRRRLGAEERGEDFDEPPPDSSASNGTNSNKSSD